MDRQVYIDKANELKKETLDKIATAPIKRGWNRTFGVSIPGVNDVKREFNARLGAINDMCVGDGHAPLYEEEKVEMQSFK